jgi:hypothetical protein
MLRARKRVLDGQIAAIERHIESRPKAALRPSSPERAESSRPDLQQFGDERRSASVLSMLTSSRPSSATSCSISARHLEMIET